MANHLITPLIFAQVVCRILTGHKWARSGDKEFRDELTDGPVKEETIKIRFGPSDQLRTVDELIEKRLAPIGGFLKQIESERGGRDQVLFFHPSSPVCHDQNTGKSWAWKESCIDPRHGEIVCWEHYDMAYNELYAIVRVKYCIRRVAEKTESIEALQEYAILEADADMLRAWAA